MGGAPVWEPIKWNLATIFYSLQGLLILLVGIAMLFGDDAVIPEQMKPLNSSQVKLVGTTELTLSAYLFGSILAGHAQAMQPFCALFMLVALVLHAVIGDWEGCPLIVVLAMAHLCLGLFWGERTKRRSSSGAADSRFARENKDEVSRTVVAKCRNGSYCLCPFDVKGLSKK